MPSLKLNRQGKKDGSLIVEGQCHSLESPPPPQSPCVVYTMKQISEMGSAAPLTPSVVGSSTRDKYTQWGSELGYEMDWPPMMTYSMCFYLAKLLVS
jgi:hypothetical protein